MLLETHSPGKKWPKNHRAQDAGHGMDVVTSCLCRWAGGDSQAGMEPDHMANLSEQGPKKDPCPRLGQTLRTHPVPPPVIPEVGLGTWS